jgi:multifunctional 2-oxoglutarate metabolism enzyme
MSQTAPADPLLDALVSDFGGNYVFALDLLESYRQDPGSIEASWREYFDRVTGARAPAATHEPAAPRSAAVPAAKAAEPVGAAATPAAPAEPARLARVEPPTLQRAPVPSSSRALAVPAILPGDIAQPIRGGAMRIVENMEASLTVPTATSMRDVPVRTLEENRAILNKHRASTGGSKISFTHLVAWAVLRGLDTFPRLNDAYAELEGQPHRIQRESVRLGIAVDVQKKDGTRTLLVPNIKDAQKLDFPSFVKAFDDLVARSRKGQISPDDFMGTTVSITNPGVIGTTASTPRLMPGQGVIIATGALDFPAEFRSMTPRTLSLLGISKVMTVTSTYDHRIIQGAESGLFLSRVEELLKGEDGFYERAFEEAGVPQRPVQWAIDLAPALGATATGSREEMEKQAHVLRLIRNFRVRGHLLADLDPLDSRRAPHDELEPSSEGLTLWDFDREFITNGLAGKERATLREILDILRDTYCGTVGVEYMFIQESDRRRWLQSRMEATRNRGHFDTAQRRHILEKLVEAESFERFLHSKYIGHKRFSLEGCEALIPLLDRLLNDAAASGMREVVMGMAHRGRLNVLANTVGKPLAKIFAEFEGDVDPDSVLGSGDVKYHLGASGVHRSPDGRQLTVSVAPNPSHLEAVDPVVEGMVRAKQDNNNDLERVRHMPVLLHGDAAFAGQGVVAETLNLAGLEGYATGGTIHVIVDNQIGFTTLPHDARSSTYCTDVARMVQAPIFHVNGDDPEAVVHVAGLAYEYRQHWKRDVVIDMVGYRRWGHNEGDEPSYTQPLMYAKIKTHPSVAQIYGEALVRQGVITAAELEALWAEKKAAVQRDEAEEAAPVVRPPQVQPAAVDASAMRGRLRTILKALGTVPAGFELHPKLQAFLRKRADLLDGKGEVDWSTGETLAFGTLLLEGLPVRLSGQDSGRGTFSQRHAVLYDMRTGREYIPLNAVAPPPARFEVYDSLLSEYAVLGFEFGYSVAEYHTLVLWEAQFGDFMNGAQILIDQFLAGTEQKWSQPTGLVLLLPHGYEGQGPEHSSARIERFLTLAAEGNLRVAYPSTPASYFHLLRRQGRDPQERPLIVFTPKSLLRHPRCVSSLDELAEGRFEEVIDDRLDPARVRRVVMTSGKLYYDLLKAREDARLAEVALVRVEQLYPFPAQALARVVERYASAELVWAQEEPRNMGAWRFVRERFLDGDVPAGGRALRYAGRKESASPAAGSHKVHVQEQEALVKAALGTDAAVEPAVTATAAAKPTA